MEVQINWWAVVLAPIVSMVVGMVWYARPVFGNMWAKLAKVDIGKSQSMLGPIAKSIVFSLIAGYVLAHVTYLSNHFYTENSWMSSALQTAFFMWLGFQLTQVMIHDSFEGRPWKLSLLSAGNQFVTLMGMGLVIGLLKL